MSRMTCTMVSACLLLLGGLVGVSPSTQAASDVVMEKAEVPGVAVNKDHCVLLIDPVKEGEHSSTVKEIGCYATFAEAIAAGTDGAVILPESATPETITEADVAPAARRLIGIDYDGRSYTGATRSWFADDGCSDRRTFRANMPASFNNRLTSTRAFSGCRRNDSFSGFFQTGFVVRSFPNRAYIGDRLNNQTSSKRWSGDDCCDWCCR